MSLQARIQEPSITVDNSWRITTPPNAAKESDNQNVKALHWQSSKKTPQLTQSTVLNCLHIRGLRGECTKKVVDLVYQNPKQQFNYEAVAELLAKFQIKTLQDGINDQLPGVEKVQAFLEMYGPLTAKELIEEINGCAYVTSLTPDTVYNLLKLLVRHEKIKKTGELYSPKNEHPERNVYLLARPLQPPLQGLWHRAVKLTENPEKEHYGFYKPGPIYEVKGKEFFTTNTIPMMLFPGSELDPMANSGVQEDAVVSKTQAIPTAFVGTTRSDLEIRLFHQGYLHSYPNYIPLTNDCRTHARDLIRFLTGVDIGTVASPEYGH